MFEEGGVVEVERRGRVVVVERGERGWWLLRRERVVVVERGEGGWWWLRGEREGDGG